VTDSRPEDETDRPAEPELPGDVNTNPPVPTSQAGSRVVERRAFLRQLTSEAVTTSGRLAGLSSIVRRSLLAAAQSGVGAVGPTDDAAAVAVQPVAAELPATAQAAAPAPAPAAVSTAIASTATPPDAVATRVALSERQDEFLANATSAVLGLNDVAGAPHLTASRFHWDGTLIRLPSDLFAARVARIESDPRVSVLVTNLEPDAWVAIDGIAAVVSGDAVAEAMTPILGKYMTAEAAEQAWTELLASGNPVVIEIRPSRYVWRFR
jgi:hypothetical protein